MPFALVAVAAAIRRIAVICVAPSTAAAIDAIGILMDISSGTRLANDVVGPRGEGRANWHHARVVGTSNDKLISQANGLREGAVGLRARHLATVLIHRAVAAVLDAVACWALAKAVDALLS